jgi:hypothetical protein
MAHSNKNYNTYWFKIWHIIIKMSAVFTVRSLLYCFHICALVNEVLNFFRLDMMPPIAEEDPLWLLESSFPFLFCAAVLALSRPMGRVTSSSVPASLEETNTSIVDGASDLALHLGWYLTPSHQWKHLNSAPVRFLYHCFVISRTMASSALLCLFEDSWLQIWLNKDTYLL